MGVGGQAHPSPAEHMVMHVTGIQEECSVPAQGLANAMWKHRALGLELGGFLTSARLVWYRSRWISVGAKDSPETGPWVKIVYISISS